MGRSITIAEQPEIDGHTVDDSAQVASCFILHNSSILIAECKLPTVHLSVQLLYEL